MSTTNQFLKSSVNGLKRWNLNGGEVAINSIRITSLFKFAAFFRRLLPAEVHTFLTTFKIENVDFILYNNLLRSFFKDSFSF